MSFVEQEAAKSLPYPASTVLIVCTIRQVHVRQTLTEHASSKQYYPLPLFFMSDEGSSSTMMVALIAIVVIIAIGFIVLQVVPGMNDNGGGADINVEVPDVTPGE